MHHRITAVEFEQVDMTKSGKIVFETVPYRWLIILVFSGLVVNVAWATVGFSSYVGQIRTAYGVSKWAVILVIIMPTILYAPINFSAAWFYNNW